MPSLSAPLVNHGLRAMLGVALTLGSVVAADAVTLDRRVRIVNDSKREIVGFYGMNLGLRDWPASLLGDDTLRPGASVVLNFEDGSGYCRYKFRAVFDDAVELIRESVNVCEVGTYRYTD